MGKHHSVSQFQLRQGCYVFKVTSLLKQTKKTINTVTSPHPQPTRHKNRCVWVRTHPLRCPTFKSPEKAFSSRPESRRTSFCSLLFWGLGINSGPSWWPQAWPHPAFLSPVLTPPLLGTSSTKPTPVNTVLVLYQ